MEPPHPRRNTMNRKPVLQREAKTVLTIPSDEFHAKLLCDGAVINLGDACTSTCTYCYVGGCMYRQDKSIIDAHNAQAGTALKFPDVVIRRTNSIELLRMQLVDGKGKPRYADPLDNRVVLTSTVVDPAGNMELLRETGQACLLTLENTNWQIRLLSKSSSLHKLIDDGMIPSKYHQRLIFGYSTGTLDDKVAFAIETGTALVSKRLESLYWLQDRGFRTYGMICPSLPQADYDRFSRETCEAIRVDRCEEVWAEVINVRGASLTKTLDSLRVHGLADEAEMLAAVSGPRNAGNWEQYARSTFLAHANNVPKEKFHFLQYISPGTEDWWAPARQRGAVLLGKLARQKNLTTQSKMNTLQDTDIRYLKEREKIVTQGVKASIAAAKALFEIHSYKNGALWKEDFITFELYCRSKWEYSKSHSYRLLDCGGFINDLETQSPIGDRNYLPANENQVRALLMLPKESRLDCWREITAKTPASKLTGKLVKNAVKHHVEANGIVGPNSTKTADEQATDALINLRKKVDKLDDPDEFRDLLNQIGIAIAARRKKAKVAEVAASEELVAV